MSGGSNTTLGPTCGADTHRRRRSRVTLARGVGHTQRHPGRIATSPRRRQASPIVLLALCFSSIYGCSADTANSPKTDVSVSRTATSGPVSLTLTVSPDDLDITQRATVTIEVVSDPNVDVTVGDYARAVRGGEHRFEIGVMEGAATPTVPRDDGKRVSTRRYSLTFYLPGEYELPPAAVSFQTQVDTAADDQTSNPADSTGVERLATEPITVTARDESGRQLSPEQLREITTLDPIDLPIPWTKQWWIWVGLTALSALACVILIAPLRRWLLRWLRGDGQSRAVRHPGARMGTEPARGAGRGEPADQRPLPGIPLPHQLHRARVYRAALHGLRR